MTMPLGQSVIGHRCSSLYIFCVAGLFGRQRVSSMDCQKAAEYAKTFGAFSCFHSSDRHRFHRILCLFSLFVLFWTSCQSYITGAWWCQEQKGRRRSSDALQVWNRCETAAVLYVLFDFIYIYFFWGGDLNDAQMDSRYLWNIWRPLMHKTSSTCYEASTDRPIFRVLAQVILFSLTL